MRIELLTGFIWQKAYHSDNAPLSAGRCRYVCTKNYFSASIDARVFGPKYPTAGVIPFAF